MAKGVEEEREEIKLEPRVELEETGPCRLKVRIEVPAEKIRALVDRRYEKLNESVQVPGFRRGHAPRNLLERRFGKEMLDELKHDLVDKGFKEAAEERKLEPISEPTLLEPEKLGIQPEAPFAYAVEIETMPKVEVKDYAGLKVKKPKIPVQEKEIDEAIEELRDSRAEWEPVQDAAVEGDQVVVDMKLAAGGEEISTQENASLVLAEGVHIHGVPLEGFHKGLVGKRGGDSAEYATTLPADFPDERLAGKQVTIQVALKGIKRKRLPELDAEFFKIFDVDDAAELREEVTKRLKKQKEREARLRMFADLMTQIMSANEFPLPESLIQRGAEDQLRMSAVNLIQQGAPPEEVGRFLEERRPSMQEDAKRSLREHMIVDAIAKAEKIFVTEEEVEQHIARMAAGLGRGAEELHAELDAGGMTAGLRRSLKTDKIMEFLLSKAVVEEES
jgi:trigger factor